MIDPAGSYTLKDCSALTGRPYHRVANAVERGRLIATRSECGSYQVRGADLLTWRDGVSDPRAFLEPVYRPVPVDAPPEPLTADEIRVIRARLGLSQGQLAGRLGCTQSAVANWESGRYTPGRRATIKMRNLLVEPDRLDEPAL
jgi:DNA-binding XRE family transcriptional regulator